MRVRRWTALVACLLVLALVLAGCGGGKQETAQQPGQDQQLQQPRQGEARVPQEFVYNLHTEPPSLDPAIATDVPSFTVATAIYEGLTRISQNGIEPGMAENWQVSDDGLTWTFRLRDAKWWDGTPVTAHDFVYAWTRVLDPRTAAEYAYQLYYIKGGEEFNTYQLPEDYGKDEAVTKKVDEDLARLASQLGVQAPDDRTLVVTLAHPTPYFLNLTSFPTLFPVHRKNVEANKNWAAEANTIIGNGPFKITEWVHKDRLVIEKNPTYWDAEKVKLEKITFLMIEEESTALTMYENGQLDVTEPPAADTPRLLASGEAKAAPYFGTYYYLINIRNKPFNDVRVRQALSLAIDRKQIVENVTRGGQKPATAWVPPGALNPVTGKDFREEGINPLSYDPEKARQLLADAGYPNGQGFPEFTILYNTREDHKAVAEAIQQMWAQNLGLKVKLQNMEWGVFLRETRQGKYEVARNGWIGDYADPMTFMDLWVSGSEFNSTGWRNAEYDKLIQTAKTTGDQKVRFEAMHKAEEILLNELPIIPIYFYTRLYMERPWIKGIYRDAVAGIDFKYAYVEPH